MPTTFTNGIGDDAAGYLAALEGDLSAPGLPGRIAYHALGAVPEAAMGIGRSLAGITGTAMPDDYSEDTRIAPGKGFAAGLTDFVGGGLLPMGLEIAATGGAGRVLGLGKLATKSPLAARTAQDALAFGMLGAQEGRTVGVEQAAEGVGYGLLAGLPRRHRILPAAALALWSKNFFDAEGDNAIMPGSNITTGDVAGVAGFGTALLPGVLPGRIRAPRPVNPWTTAVNQPSPSVQPINPWITASLPTATPPIQPNPATIANAQVRRRMGYDPNAVGNPNLLANIEANPMGRPAGPLSGIPAAESADAVIENLLPTRAYTAPQPMVEPVLTGKLAAKSAQVIAPDVVESLAPPIKGKINPLPEFRRTEGGEIVPELLQNIGMPLLRAGVGAGVGAAGADAAGLDPTLGAAIGAGAFSLPGLMRGGIGLAQKLARPIVEQNNMGAIRDPFMERPIGKPRIISTAIKNEDGTLTLGEQWNQKHMTLLDEHLEYSPNKGADASSALDNMGFMIEDANGMIRFADRTEAATLAKQTGQAGQDFRNNRLISEDLKFPAVEAGNVSKGFNYVEPEARTFAKELNQKISTKAKEAEAMFDYNVEPNDVIYSRQTGEAFTVVNKGYPTKTKDGSRSPMLLLKDKDGNVNPHKVFKDGTTEPFWSKNPDSLEPVKVFEGLRGLRPKEGGYVLQPLQAAMSRAVLGGITGGAVGGAVDGQDGFLPGAFVGALALGMGPAVARTLSRAMSNTKSIPLQGTPSKAKSYTNLAKNWGQTVEDASGRAMSANAGASDRFLRFLDKAFEITLPAVIKETLMKSRGMASHLLDTLDGALTKVSLRYKPDQVLKDAANAYLDGSSNMTQAQLMQIAGNDVQATKFAEMIITGREAINGLQRMTADGVGDPNMAKMINDSIGKYVTRSYRLFTKADWEPTVQSIDNLVKEITTKKLWGGASAADARTALEQYVREVKQSKGIYGKTFGGGQGYGAKIDQQVLKERKMLSDEWKEFLGEITDPTERLYQTVFRLRPMAEASRYMDQLTMVKEDGWLPHRFTSYMEKDTFHNKLVHDVQTAHTPADQAAAQAKLDKFNTKWQGAQNVENHPKFGSLQGNVVTRNVWDTLSTFDSLTDPSRSPLLRSISGLHTAIKLGRTAFNPITVVRNFVTMPMFATIAKANPMDMADAWKIMKDVNHPMRAEVMKNGIANVDQVKTEFFKEFDNITGGKYEFGNIDLQNLGLGKFDLDTVEKYGRRGIRNWLDVYRLPDNMVRIGSYLSAKRRFAQALGKGLDDPEVLQKAISFTNRYTMNYDTIAPAIKTLRQLPFTNLFISYTAEMTRILKNLAVDVVKGSGADGINHSRSYAAMPLAMLAVLPELLQQTSEDGLSPKDKADWENTKKLLPDYSRTRYRMGLSKNAQGNFEYFDITPLIASDSLNQTVKALATGDMNALAAVNPIVNIENTPALNIVSAQVAGRDLHTFREFRNTSDRVASVAKEVLPPWFPGIGGEARRFDQAHSRNESGELGLTNEKTGQKLTPADFWLPYYTGVKSGEANQSVLQQRAVSTAKRDIANEVAYLNDVLRTDAPADKKQLALDKAKMSIAEIQENLRGLLQTPDDRK